MHFLNVFKWSIVNLQWCANFCCTAKWLIYTHTYIFEYSFLLWLIPGDWIYFPALYGKTLLFMHSKHNSLKLLTPNSQSIPNSPLVTTSPAILQSMDFQRVRHDWVTELTDWFSVCEPVSISERGSFGSTVFRIPLTSRKASLAPTLTSTIQSSGKIKG